MSHKYFIRHLDLATAFDVDADVTTTGDIGEVVDINLSKSSCRFVLETKSSAIGSDSITVKLMGATSSGGTYNIELDSFDLSDSEDVYTRALNKDDLASLNVKSVKSVATVVGSATVVATAYLTVEE